MTDKEKLLKILRDLYPGEIEDTLETVAGYLLEAGVTFREWTPVTEGLPEKDMRCIAVTDSKRPFIRFVHSAAVVVNKHNGNVVGCYAWGVEFTHWMHIPDLPEEADNGT